MSPRRSSRARTTQPPPNAPQHTTSSNSSNSLPRTERSARSHQKLQSPQSSSTQRSESLDNPEFVSRGEGPTTRRSRRNDTEPEDASKTNGDEIEYENGDGEEVTRCICGNLEYSGPPSFIRESVHRGGTKTIVKDEHLPNGSASGQEALTDDSGNFFIQCDHCQVWQHGGCVGLIDEAMSPDEYFCEGCRPELHKIRKSPNGAKSSLYRPVVEASTPHSTSSSSRADSRKPESKVRAGAAALSTKRRATMNSRDAAYDEEEILKRVIEESKEISGSLGKRAREDNDEEHLKRQRVTSDPPSSRSKNSRSPSRQASDNEVQGVNLQKAGGHSRKVRANAARTNQEKEMKERQSEREKQRIEQASRRNARSERRRAEDSPPPTPSVSPSKAGNNVPQPSQRANGVDSPSNRPATSNPKKTGRPPTKRGRLGRNQYTRDLPIPGEDSSRHDRSRDGQGSHGSPTNGVNGGHTENGRPSRPRQHPTRTSMNEMKRRVAAILEFVSRVQVDPHGSSHRERAPGLPNGVGPKVPSTAVVVQEIGTTLSGPSVEDDSSNQRKDHRNMDSKEMMVHLCQDLKNWQTQHGKYGEK